MYIYIYIYLLIQYVRKCPIDLSTCVHVHCHHHSMPLHDDVLKASDLRRTMDRMTTMFKGGVLRAAETGRLRATAPVGGLRATRGQGDLGQPGEADWGCEKGI